MVAHARHPWITAEAYFRKEGYKRIKMAELYARVEFEPTKENADAAERE